MSSRFSVLAIPEEISERASERQLESRIVRGAATDAVGDDRWSRNGGAAGLSFLLVTRLVGYLLSPRLSR